MRGSLVALLVLTAWPALADDMAIQLDNRHPHKALWLNAQMAANLPFDSSVKAPPKFTKTYLDGVAQRFGIGPGGHVNLFERRLNGGAEGGPALVGTIDHGAAVLALKWRPGE